MNETVLVDTGFWIALFDPREKQHAQVGEKEEWLESATLIVPWPILYETLRTRFVKRPGWVLGLSERLKKPNVEFIDDQRYREEAYKLTIEYSTRLERPISMVDMLCRLLIADKNIRVNYLLTTNPGDFIDVCGSNGVELL